VFLRLLIIGILVMTALQGGIASAAERIDYEAYAAARGQTVAAIAAEYGLDPVYLAQVNRIGANEPLRDGQMIVIPSDAPPAATRPEQANGGNPDGTTGETMPANNMVQGKLGAIIAETTKIFAQPGPGEVLFEKARRGTELLVLGTVGDYYGIMMADGNIGFLPKKVVGLTDRMLAVERPMPPPPPPEPEVNPLVKTTFEYLGIPYRYGGRLPKNVDCSLLVQTVFARHGLKLPRVAADQYNVGQPVAVQELQSGDRLYFYNRARTKIGHTGLYIGNGTFIHASANRGKVAVDDLSNATYWSIYAGARR
jgi:hypothetical protein